MIDQLNYGSYRKLTNDPRHAILTTMKREIMYIGLDKETKKKLLPRDNVKPRIYMLPKIHKENILLRSIVNTIRSPMYRLSKFLAGKLRHMIGHASSYVKDFTGWINEIKRDRLEDNDILIHFDMVSLYTKIPITEAINIIKNKVDNDIAKSGRAMVKKSTYFCF